ncbi:MAG: flavodoxin family protein [Bacteroidales bacterium]|nr:flavodoxin family protein [Bacteroidales bacterium]
MKNFIIMASAILLFSACRNNADVLPTASLASVSGIKFSDTTPNPKEGKRVLVISSSPRPGGNTDLLCDEFVRGAQEAGGDVEKVFLADLQLEFLSEDGANKPHDVSRDSDTGRLVDKFLDADVVCLASPTYYMNVNDRMKAFIDATYLAWGDEKMGNKEYYYITACAQNSVETAQWCLNGFRGFVMCMPNPTERGYVTAIALGRPGAVKDTQYMQEAYNLGKSINKR